ncbi:MAG: response regulator with CheY-like protein receiver domain and winged-helix DNA-binding-like protein [Candidatus Kaiserbacteria bacterium]|nr:response regulator with CheY-like protein receiver domain and winged-helix DNA-binding-like protein [Candidatus Kaiserbacteria bacterium]
MENTNQVPKKILCVEDDETIRTTLSEGLRAHGHTVIEAKNGEEGWKTALTEHPDLIVLDMVMPILNGMDCLRHIRQDAAWGKNAHVVFFTNNDAIEEVSDAMTLNVTKYIIKSSRSLEDIIADIEFELVPKA